MIHINVLAIIVSHFRTLRSGKRRGISIFEIAVFFLMPIIIGLISYTNRYCAPFGIVGLSVSVFSIFAALLLSVQVAIYSIFSAKKVEDSDPVVREIESKRTAEERILLRELNINVSYLILLSCLCIAILFVVFLIGTVGKIISAAILALFSHFFLTLLMVVRRAHAIFDVQYR